MPLVQIINSLWLTLPFFVCSRGVAGGVVRCAKAIVYDSLPLFFYRERFPMAAKIQIKKRCSSGFAGRFTVVGPRHEGVLNE